MKWTRSPVWLIVLLILTTLACAQAGEILTPEEATRQAEEARAIPSTGGSNSAIGATFSSGDTATIVGDNFLVNLHLEPAGRISAALQRGTDVTIMESTVEDNEVWYKVQSPGGDGWLSAENLGATEGEEGTTAEGGDGTESGQASAFSPGDTAYLIAQGFLANLYREPGGLILAVENKGAEAEILDVTNHEGKNWYLVRVSAGDGWVPEEGLSAEPP